MFKIFQAKFQQYLNREPPDLQAGFRKGRETRDQIANICWIIEKAKEFQKNIYFCFIDYMKAFAFSKPSLYIYKLSVHILLKPSLKDFEHNLINM